LLYCKYFLGIVIPIGKKYKSENYAIRLTFLLANLMSGASGALFGYSDDRCGSQIVLGMGWIGPRFKEIERIGSLVFMLAGLSVEGIASFDN